MVSKQELYAFRDGPEVRIRHIQDGASYEDWAAANLAEAGGGEAEPEFGTGPGGLNLLETLIAGVAFFVAGAFGMGLVRGFD